MSLPPSSRSTARLGAPLLLAVLLAAAAPRPVAAQGEIVLAPPTATPSFGRAVDLQSSYAVVGAPQGADGRGAAYVYRYDAAAGWALDGELLAPGGVSGDGFGTTVAIGANARVAVGAPAAGVASSDGTVYVFRRTSPGAWAVEATFTGPGLGRALGFDENVLAAAGTPVSNRIYIRTWRRTGTSWSAACSHTEDRSTSVSGMRVALPYIAYTGGYTDAQSFRVLDASSCGRLLSADGSTPSVDDGSVAYRVARTTRRQPFTDVVFRPTLHAPAEVIYTGGGSGSPRAAALALRGEHLAVSGSGGSALFVFRKDTTETREWPLSWRSYPTGHLSGAIALSNRYVLAGGQGQAYLVDLATLEFRDRPALYAPAARAVEQTTPLTFSWGALDDALSYTLEVDNDSLFGSPVVAESGLLDTTFVVERGLASDRTFYWRVRGERADAVGVWSRFRRFTTATTRPPSPPALSSPVNNAQNRPLSLTLQWAAAGSASGYRVQLATEPTFASPTLDAETTALSQAVSGLAGGQAYYWRVRSRNAAGVSDWSAVWLFRTTPTAPVVPTPVAPADGAAGVSRTPLFVWSRPSQAATYTLQASRSATFNNLVVNATVSDTTFQVTTPLTANRQHYWRVRAQNSAGTTAWSPVFTFSTGTAADAKAGALPAVLALSDPQPNPSGGAVTFHVDVPEAGPVRLAVFDALGREVAVLLDGETAAGTHPATLDGRALPAGVYVARLTAGGTALTRRLTIAR